MLLLSKQHLRKGAEPEGGGAVQPLNIRGWNFLGDLWNVAVTAQTLELDCLALNLQSATCLLSGFSQIS